jgi:DNA-binding GntR family transcriptional regulator
MLKQLASEKALNGAAKRDYRVPDLTRLQSVNLFQMFTSPEGGAVAHLKPMDFTALHKLIAALDAARPAGDTTQCLDANFLFHSLIYSWGATMICAI